MSPPSKNKPRKHSISGPETFTLRDLNRQPAKVLAACDRHGTVRIRTRDGRSYALKAENLPPPRTGKLESILERRQQLRQRLRSAGFVAPSPAETAGIYRLIAGDE